MKTFAPHFSLGLIAAAVVTLTACGGGGGGSDSTSPTAATTPVTTTVMDGLISNALVCVDSNSNGLCEATETQGRTDASGKVTLSIATADLATAKLLAVIGTDATDADTGAVTTAYTLQTPAGKHAVISPLTDMVQTKIKLDKANGIVTSIDAAEAYVKTQTSLTVSVFDNFIAKRDTNAEFRKAGEVARLLVVSLQESQKAAATTANCKSSTDQDEDDHTRENHIEDDLLTKLTEIRTLSDDIAKSCSSTHSVKDCDDAYKSHARIVSTCTAPAPVAQTITFAAPATVTLGTAAPALAATATSGLAVTFASSTPTVCTVTGTALTLVAAGACTVTATQAGNASYSTAAAVAHTFTVATAPTTPVTPVTPPVATAQTITFAAPANQTLGTATPALVATSSSGLAVTFTSSTPSVCTVNGTALTLVAAGSCTVTASQPGSTSYAAAAEIARTFTVAASATVVVSATNGKVIYNTAFNGSTCASCHSPMPALNVSKVLNGANSASKILSAINGNTGGMGILKGLLSTSQLNDLAAYLATPSI